MAVAAPQQPLLWALRVALAVVALVALLVLLDLAAALAPDFAGNHSIAVDSTGLQPAIPQGAMLVEQPVPVTALKPGDIVSFGSNETPGVIFTMQVSSWTVAAGGSAVQLHTKPIGGGEERLWLVPSTEPVGRLWYWVPWAGAASHLLSSPIAWLVLIAAGAVLLWWSLRGAGKPSAPVAG